MNVMNWAENKLLFLYCACTVCGAGSLSSRNGSMQNCKIIGIITCGMLGDVVFFSQSEDLPFSFSILLQHNRLAIQDFMTASKVFILQAATFFSETPM